MHARRRLQARCLGLALAVAAALATAAAPAAIAAPPHRDRDSDRTAAVTLAGKPCRLLPAANDAVVVASAASAACPGVRPGAAILTPLGLCTFNFLWQGTDGHTYAGTAGHCLLEGTGTSEAVFPPGSGPVALDGQGAPVGRFAYAALDAERDFALVRLDPGVAAADGTCGAGGPTGLDRGPVTPLAGLHYVGQGSFTGDLVPARMQLVLADDALTVTGLGLASPGDSGAPVFRGDGRAVGVLVATGPGLPLGLLGAGLVSFAVKVGPQVDRASLATGIGFTLRTAPLVQALA